MIKIFDNFYSANNFVIIETKIGKTVRVYSQQTLVNKLFKVYTGIDAYGYKDIENKLEFSFSQTVS